MTEAAANGGTGRSREDDLPPLDPAYRLPVVGPLLREADRLRTALQGEALTRKEADLLRGEARALRHLAGYLEARAAQLERNTIHETKPRVTRVKVDR